MGRFAKKRYTAEERAAIKLRRHEHLRQVKTSYVHKNSLHGEFVHPGDDTLVELLALIGKDRGPLLACCNERHAKRLEALGHDVVWHTERPVDPDEVLLGSVFRKPDASGPIQRLRFSQPLSSAFVCERLQKQDNLHAYLVALREAVKIDAPVGLVVPLAHHELVDDHVNLFTVGTLIYNLVRAGWNCKQASIKLDPRFIKVVVRRLDVPTPWPQSVEDLRPFTPFKNVFQYCSSEFPETYR